MTCPIWTTIPLSHAPLEPEITSLIEELVQALTTAQLNAPNLNQIIECSLRCKFFNNSNFTLLSCSAKSLLSLELIPTRNTSADTEFYFSGLFKVRSRPVLYSCITLLMSPHVRP
jgi:hypothetical protein